MTPPPVVVQGDALVEAQRLAADGMVGAFTLVYLDPPFFTRRRQTGAAGGYEDGWGGNLDTYLAWLDERVRAIQPLLRPDGAILLHLDWRAVHYAKVLCDGVFGFDAFVNEIVWAYNSGGGSKHHYGRKHDTILWYGTGLAPPHFDADAARVPYSATITRKRQPLFHADGKVSGDVLSITRPPNHAAEWLGWPTQKPLALLEWFVRVHSRPGDWVGDFCCGSGTTLLAAARHGRRAFGCDINADALELTRRRLAAELDPVTAPPPDRIPAP